MDRGRKDLDRGRKDLDRGRKDLDRGRKDLDRGRKDMDRGRKGLEKRSAARESELSLADPPHELRRGGFACHRLGDRATVPVVGFLGVLARWALLAQRERNPRLFS